MNAGERTIPGALLETRGLSRDLLAHGSLPYYSRKWRLEFLSLATFEWDGSRFTFVTTVQNMTEIIAAHIHGPASSSQNADIILNLFFIPSAPTGAINGELARGAVVAGSHLLVGGTTLNEVLALLRSGQSYLLVHTSQNPDGEIRGQMSVVN